MQLEEKIYAFSKLGKFLSQFSYENYINTNTGFANDQFFESFKNQLQLAELSNNWFTKENLNFAINSWAEALTDENLKQWLSKYNFENTSSKTIAIIMAGNIPLVGFHDFLCVLISGHNVLVKLSSNDKILLPFLAQYLEHIEPSFKGKIKFTEEKLENYDAVIATGSNNTARYFEYYFKNKPHIIRQNRNSIAILSGNENIEDLKLLSEDIFRYYGLGCRNVSKLYVPKNYDFSLFFEAIYPWHHLINQVKYANNYDYNKAVFLMSEFNLLENSFFMIKEDENMSSPIATLFYEYYDDINLLKEKISEMDSKIQCVVGQNNIEHEIAFGKTQKPELWDYADHVDTLDFLLKL